MVGLTPSDITPTLGAKVIAAGSAGCVADLITFPLDTAKVRLQIQGESTQKKQKGRVTLSKARKQREQFKYRGVFGTIATITRQEGAKSLYNGLVPGLQRQMCFCAVRIGCYDSVRQAYTEKAKRNGYNGPAILIRIAAGITTGALAVTCAQPTDVVKVRMQAQVNVGAVRTVRYSGALDAYRSIAKFEGIQGLWKGIMPNITRNAIVNASELVAYDMIKERILRAGLMRDIFPLHVVAAFGAGFVTTCVASPVDVVKTRYMNSKEGQYKSAIDCARKMFKEGGPVAFYKGFMPNFIRLGAWNIVMFVTFEQLKRVAIMARQRQVQ